MSDGTTTYEQDLAKTLESVVDSSGMSAPSIDNTISQIRTEPSLNIGDLPTTPGVSSVPGLNVTPADDSTVNENNSDTEVPSQQSSDASLSPLEGIKKDAIVELRPLVGKLNLSPEETFDTYLLLIRSTDDQELIAPAHEAAKAIEDETRRAEALLDIIKEIDYLTNPKTAAA